MKIYKPYSDIEYSELAIYCNDNNCHIVDKGEYLESEKNNEYIPTCEDIRLKRIYYRQHYIDNKTNERSRKIANGSWTNEDEQEYLKLDSEITKWIEENLPYPLSGE